MTDETYNQDNIHTERAFQNHLINQLIKQQNYIKRDNTDYDKEAALDKELLIQFIKDTQNEEWVKLEEQYSTSTEKEFFKQLEKALKQRGTLDVLRQGIKLIPNIQFSLCFFKPASSLNKELLNQYEANILSVIDELEYSTKNGNRIDIALFVNGIPLATLECKNLSTNTTFRYAESQYKKDRSPAGEPLLTFKRGALVHFALDQDNISMTTRLNNGKTRFLPFNQGRDGGAGNPDAKNEFRISYLYANKVVRISYLYADQVESKAIFSREIFLDIIGRFMHLDNNEGKEVMIFPRFQQLDAVLKMIGHAKEHGTGHNYLIQHSAGSGKSNTIAWTAHRLINLHDDNDKAIFNTAIIVTDRVVLDRQLQNTVSQFEQTKGVVKKIDGTSRQLKEAIQNGARIIITTIHKFSTEHLKEISGQGKRKFAVLVDEAHGSQSGRHADNLAKALIRDNDENAPSDIEEVIAEYQRQRGPQANLSYFAFTATPRNVTLERFGVKGQDGLPQPFHLYSMRQAIEEEFILDVLQNYMTYKAYYQLEKGIEDDPKFTGRRAKRKIARFATLHPTAIDQKVEVIVEHFQHHVAKEMGGSAKAMVVTQSREHALKYYFAIKKYIENRDYDTLKALVAFSGEIKSDGQTYTEVDVNGFSETELPKKFETKEYQLLIVAEKYQTGFDQPKLCAMYIDRKLDGLQAVQTISRLNRTSANKQKTFVLDFQNTVEDIQFAFKPFFEVTSVEAISDPNQIYELEGRIKSFAIIDYDEVNRFAETYYKRILKSYDRTRLEQLVRNAVLRFEYEEDEGKREEFRQLLKSYTRFYSFIAQIVRLDDTSLEKLFNYSAWLIKLLPNRLIPPEIEITEDMLLLQAFRVEEKENENASLKAGETEDLSPIDEFGANKYTEDEEKALSEIIESFNQRYGTEFTIEDFVRFEQVHKDVLENEELRERLKNNPPDVVSDTFSAAFFEGIIELFKKDNQLHNTVMNDEKARDHVISHFFTKALKEVKSEKLISNQ